MHKYVLNIAGPAWHATGNCSPRTLPLSTISHGLHVVSMVSSSSAPQMGCFWVLPDHEPKALGTAPPSAPRQLSSAPRFGVRKLKTPESPPQGLPSVQMKILSGTPELDPLESKG